MEQMPPETEVLSSFGKTVFRHLVMGKSEKDIAAALQSSSHTVHGQIKIIYRQFNVSSKPALISLMLTRQAEEIQQLRRRLGGDGATTDDTECGGLRLLT